MTKENLQKFLLALSPEARRSFARKCGTTHGQLKQIYCGNRSCNPRLAIEIEKHSKGEISCESLCPEVDFEYLRKAT